MAEQSVTSDTSTANERISQKPKSVKSDFSLKDADYQKTVESEDTIVYDDDGRIIPISERFNENKKDIRYSLKDSDTNQKLESRVDEGYTDNADYSLYTDEVMFSARYNKITQSKVTRELYNNAKKGDVESAFKLIPQLLKDDVVNKIRDLGKSAYLLPVVGIEGSSANVLPRNIADYIHEETRQNIFEGVYKEHPSNSRDNSIWGRMKENYPSFAIAEKSHIKPSDISGKKFILIDDNSTTGRTFFGLKNFIEENGGEVVGYYALTIGQDQSEKMITTDEMWNELVTLGLDEVKKFAKKEGIKREISKPGLTEREARELIEQFRKAKAYSGRGIENDARSRRGIEEIQAIVKEEKRNEEAEKRNNEVDFSLKEINDLSTKDQKELLDIIAHLKGEFEVTKFAKADPKQLAKTTRAILKDYSSRADYDTVFKAIDELYTYMANGENGESPVWTDVYNRAYNIAQEIVQNAVEVDDSIYNEYKGLREYLRTTPMKFDSLYDSVPEGYENFNEFRKRNMGRLLFTKDGTDKVTRYVRVNL